MDNGKINRRRFLQAVGVGATACALGDVSNSICIAGQGATRRLNFLWISCEDISPDLGCFGCYGDGYATNPNLDRRWLIYTRPITVAPSATLEAKTIRSGCKESETAQFQRV